MRNRPKPGETDLRGLEWRYLWKQSQGDHAATFPHETSVRWADISPDGRWLATSDLHSGISIWETTTQRRFRQFVYSGRAFDFPEQCLAFSPQGGLFVARYVNGVGVWDATTWENPRVLPSVNALVAFSRDGKVLATIGDEGFQAWNTMTWKQIISTGQLGIYRTNFQSLALSYDGTTLAVAARYDPRISIWNLNGAKNGKPFVLYPDPASSVYFNPVSLALSNDGRWLAAGNWSGYVHLWNLEKPELQTNFLSSVRSVFGLAFSPDSQTLVTGGIDQTIRFWRVGAASIQIGQFRGHSRQIWSLCFSVDGRWLASAANDHTARLWRGSPATSNEVSFIIPDQSFVLGVASNCSKIATLNTNDQIFQEWSIPSFALVKTTPIQGPDKIDSLHMLVSDLERQRVIFGTRSGEAQIWSMETGARIYSRKLASSPILPKRLSPDGHRLLIEEQNANRVVGILWNLAENKVEAKFSDYQGNCSFELSAFSPDGQWLVYAATNYQFKLWDLAAHRVTRTFSGHSWLLNSAAFSMDGKLLATCDWEGTARIWDVASGRLLAPPLEAHRAGVNWVAFSADGRTLASTGSDLEIRLWSVATGQEMFSKRMNIAHANRLLWKIPVFSQDGNLFFEVSESKIIITLLPSLAEIDALEPAKSQK